MDLQTFIEARTDAEAATLFGVKERTTASWRRGERWPRPATWPLIIDKTGGKVSVSDLLAGPRPAKAAA